MALVMLPKIVLKKKIEVIHTLWLITADTKSTALMTVLIEVKSTLGPIPPQRGVTEWKPPNQNERYDSIIPGDLPESSRALGLLSLVI